MTTEVFNWGCQHATEVLGLAASPIPLDDFLQGWFDKPAGSLRTPSDSALAVRAPLSSEHSRNQNPAVPHLTGIFLSINNAQALWSKQQWVDDLQAMKDVGIKFFCPRAAADGHSLPTDGCPFGEFTSFYPSKNQCFKPVAGMPEGGALAAILAAAKIVGLQVHLGLAWPSESALQAVGGKPINGSYAHYYASLAWLQWETARELWYVPPISVVVCHSALFYQKQPA